jgi:hypothetical protein
MSRGPKGEKRPAVEREDAPAIDLDHKDNHGRRFPAGANEPFNDGPYHPRDTGQSMAKHASEGQPLSMRRSYGCRRGAPKQGGSLHGVTCAVRAALRNHIIANQWDLTVTANSSTRKSTV